MLANRSSKNSVTSFGGFLHMAWLVVLFSMPSADGEDVASLANAKVGYKLKLTPGNSQQLLKVVRPHESEWRHLKVQWLTDVVAARKRAAAEDKPIIICYTGGAGYNEPLGVC